MEAIRKAIRSALEKGDASDRAFRERVYRQAFAALDRTLKARSDLSADDVRRRRGQVKAVIVEIEKEHLAARDASPSHAPVPPAEPTGDRQEPDFAPSVEREDRFEFESGPQASYLPEDEVRVPLAGEERGRGRFAMLFVLATVIAAVGIGAWWTIDSGILQTAGERDTGVPTPPAVEEEDFDPGQAAPARTDVGEVEETGEWITIFSPTDPTAASASAGTRVEAMTEDDETFLRVDAASADATVSFDVGAGVLEQLAGQRAVFSLTARSQEDEETQISVSCAFGTLGDCGRKRYVVGPLPSEYLFEVEFPDRQPAAGGRISIAPDIAGEGRALDIFSLRVAVGES